MLKKIGFTLAEVLIVIGIIGMIANMTIPTLMASVQEQQQVTQLKKAYTVINQALSQMATDNGCIGDLKCTGFFATGVTQTQCGTELLKYLKAVQVCGVNSTGCFVDNINTKFDGKGSNASYNNNIHYFNFVLIDGTSIALDNTGYNNCGSDYRKVTTNASAASQICGSITVDVNGLKGPNRFGRDAYLFYITNGKGPLLYPMGGSDLIDVNSYVRSNDCNSTNTSAYNCGGRIMEDGWVMNY